VRSQALALISTLVATRVFFDRFGDDVDNGAEAVDSESAEGQSSQASALNPGEVWTAVIMLCGLWIASFVAFLLLIKRKYIRTLFSSQTGFAWMMSYFLEGRSDVIKANTVLVRSSLTP
jgi:hypothetical protein